MPRGSGLPVGDGLASGREEERRPVVGHSPLPPVSGFERRGAVPQEGAHAGLSAQPKDHHTSSAFSP